MSLFPSPFLAKLQDLKLWQGNYEALLQNKSIENNSISDFDTIEGLSALDSTRSSIDMAGKQIGTPQKVEWDKKVVTPSKPFEQLLEEKLAEDQPVVVPVKPKKPFLRKGSGLTRYRMSYPQSNRRIKRNPSKQFVNKTPGVESAKSAELKISPRHQNCFRKTASGNNENTSVDFQATPLKMPDISMKPKGIWVKVQQNETPPSSKYYSDVEKEHIDKQGTIMERIGEFTLRNLLPGSPKKSAYSNKLPDIANHIEIQKIHSKSALENTEQELRVFEALEERAEHDSFSSTNSSIMRMLSSTPSRNNKSSADPPIREEFVPQKHLEQIDEVHYQNNIVNKVQEINKKQDVLHHFLNNLKHMVNQEEDQIEYRSPLARPKKTLTPDTTFSEPETNTDTRSPTSSSFYTDFENTFKSSLHNKKDVAINTSFSNKEESIQSAIECQHCDELKKQLNKLMKEIPDIQAEKARVCDFAKDLEKKRDQLNKEMQKMKNKYEKDIEDLQTELDAEKKKFVREKAVFDMYIKDSQNRPSKKEREEISILKKELVDIQELLKLKETKNGATQARLRNQIKCLEKERDELKTSVENLQKENSKLNASRRVQRPSEVKMLHEINKNLSKLTEETFKKQRSKSNSNSSVSSKENVNNGSEYDDENEEDDIKAAPKVLSKSSKKRASLEKHNLSNDHEINGTQNVSLEKQYETTFGQFNSSETRNNNLNDSKKEKVETIFPDGSKEVKYSNGNTKIISPDGNFITVRYYNGDIKEINLVKNIVKYFYSKNSTWHTQFGDGSELLEYASGQKEKTYEDGKKEITCPDGTFLTKFPDGTEEILYEDGSKMIKNTDGEKVLLLPNGQKEIHTKDHKRREYPDGTVKILYVDGTQETRYASGRVRIKDANGALIMDSNDC